MGLIYEPDPITRTPINPPIEPSPRNQPRSEIDLNAIEINTHRTHNLKDPLVDVELKVNNPVGRLWEAIKRIWKAQKTIVSLKFTIPLLVLPIVLFVGYQLWMGRGINTPMAKVGVIHEVTISGKKEYTLILPTSDVYMLGLPVDFTLPANDKAMIVFGTYNHIDNTLNVETLAYYNEQDAKANPLPTPKPLSGVTIITGTSLLNNLTQSIWTPIANFLRLFQ